MHDAIWRASGAFSQILCISRDFMHSRSRFGEFQIASARALGTHAGVTASVARVRGAFAVACLLVLTFAGCSVHRDLPDGQRIVQPTPDPVAVLRHSLDSCNSERYPSDAAGTPTDRAGSWATGAVRAIGRVSIFVPDRMRLAATDSTLGAFGFLFSDCPGCNFKVAVAVDSNGKGVEGQVALLVAEQRRVDSINKIPNAVGEFDVIDGPPTPIDIDGVRAYLIDNDCGDCLASSILFGSPGYIATVNFGGDDRMPALAQRACEMTALGETLRWRKRP
jgi:hypothetical protein